MLIVIKIGGVLVDQDLSNLYQDLSNHKRDQFILVHGGADIVTEISKTLGYNPRFVISPKGLRSRYTSYDESIIYTMVMAGRINKKIVADIQKHGISTIGLSGVDSNLVQAERKKKLVIIDERGKRMLIDGGYTGHISSINKHVLDMLLEAGFTPVIAPVAIGEENEFLNVDGDRLASRIAIEMGADKVVLLTDVKGVLVRDQIVPFFNTSDGKDIVKEVEGGMKVKLLSAVDAVKNGVNEALIASGLGDTPLSYALNGIGCTCIRNGSQ